MGKFHMMGMQCLSAYVFHIRVIQVISNQWETQMFHMDADLMCPAGLKLQRDQTVSVGFFYKSVMCDGFFTVFKINRAFDDGAFFSGKRSRWFRPQVRHCPLLWQDIPGALRGSWS